MDLQHEATEMNPRNVECMHLRHCGTWFIVLGVLVMLAGVIAVSSAVLATLTSVLIFGVLLMAGGIVQIVNAFLAREWKGFFLHLLGGILHLIVGELLIEHPLIAAEGLTLLLAAAFLVGGVTRLSSPSEILMLRL